MKAMIFAAGLGTRLKPLTDNKPKALVEVAGKPLLQHTIEHLKGFGITDFVINIHHFGDLIIDFLNEHKNFGVNVAISDEREALMNTGGGLKKALPLLDGDQPILIFNVDIVSNLDLAKVLKQHTETKALATMVVRERKTQRYLLWDKSNFLKGWERRDTQEQILVDQHANSDDLKSFAFSGIQILEPSLIKKLHGDGAFSIIPSYLEAAKENPIQCYIDDSSTWMDLGKIPELEIAEQYLKNLE